MAAAPRIFADRIERMAIDAIKPNPHNARTHSKRQVKLIAESLKTFGLLNPVLVDEAGNVWDYPGAATFSKSSEEGRLNELHPTVKPVGLIADALLDCSARGDVVLDPFLGSGSTLMAAERTRRVCRGIEIDPSYVDVAIRRWRRMTGERVVHAETGLDFADVERMLEQDANV